MKDQIPSKSTKNFAANYQKLQEIAATLRNNQSVDLDELLPMIKQATTAYQKCKSRLQAVQDAVEQHFKENDNC